MFLTPADADARQERTYSDVTAAAVEQEVRKIVDQIFDRTVALLQERCDLLERTARRLLEVETLDENELRRLAQPQPRQQDVPGVARIR